jgi:hypothetical protein
MTYRQYSDHLKVCRYLGIEPSGTYGKIKDLLTQLWSDMELTPLQDEKIILIHKNHSYLGHFNFKQNRLWLNPHMVSPDRTQIVSDTFRHHLKITSPFITDLAHTLSVEHWEYLLSEK